MMTHYRFLPQLERQGANIQSKLEETRGNKPISKKQ
jgi:hypothetical protein